MATIKAGTYRFNDVLDLTMPRAYIEYITFNVTVNNPMFGEVLGNIDYIMFWPNMIEFNIQSTQPDIGLDNTLIVPYVDGEWDFTNFDERVKIITIPTDSEVSAEFAEWFSANAVADGVQISGVWKFKDVLSGTSNDIEQSISFTMSSTAEYEGSTYTLDCICSGLGFSGESYEVNYIVDECELLAQFGYVFPSPMTFYDCGWRVGTFGEGIKTIDFGTEPQTVSAEFYNWLTANASQPTASITHNGEAIASLFAGQTATLKCAGMKMAGDVVVSVPELPEAEVVEDYDGTIDITGEAAPPIEAYDGTINIV